MISPQNFAMFWHQTKLYKLSNVFLDDFVRGQVKMDTKKRCIRVNTTYVISEHTHTVCVTYYKAAPYNISHTKIFLMAIFTLIFFYKFFFMYVYHAWKIGSIFSEILIMVISGQIEMVINWGYILKSCSTYNFYVF